MAFPNWARTVAIVAPCAVVVSFALFFPLQKLIGDGAYPLTVKVQPSGNKNIAIVMVALDGNVERAAENLERMLDPKMDLRMVDSPLFELGARQKRDPFDGRDFELLVPNSQHIHYSMVGLVCSERCYFAYRGLLVFAVMEDGQRVGKAVEIPDMKVSREVTVSLP
jgi:hypothetical protein